MILQREILLIFLLSVILPVLVVGCRSVDKEKENQKALNDRELTEEQRAMVELWERHMASEFETKSIDATMATMTSNPFVNHVPVMTGGVGDMEVRAFYSTYFIPGQPPGSFSGRRAPAGCHHRLRDETPARDLGTGKGRVGLAVYRSGRCSGHGRYPTACPPVRSSEVDFRHG